MCCGGCGGPKLLGYIEGGIGNDRLLVKGEKNGDDVVVAVDSALEIGRASCRERV